MAIKNEVTGSTILYKVLFCIYLDLAVLLSFFYFQKKNPTFPPKIYLKNNCYVVEILPLLNSSILLLKLLFTF